ncbi:Uncharacterised protein [Yersinia frederiksenii]|nr:Uncharacterised protein [Yersinia frederiksenii]
MPKNISQQSLGDKEPSVDCWSCKTKVEIKTLQCNDGLCPFCNCEIDLEDDND